MGTIRTNPIKAAREQLGLSIGQVAGAANIHRQVIIKTEQGCYADIPPRLYSYLVSRLGDSDPGYTADYQRWVAEKRIESYGRLNRWLPDFRAELHPLVQWRQESELTRTAFCKAFCVHTSTITRFETKLEQQTIPDQLIQALSASGYSSDTISEIGTRYRIYRMLTLAKRSNDSQRISNAWELARQHGTLLQSA